MCGVVSKGRLEYRPALEKTRREFLLIRGDNVRGALLSKKIQERHIFIGEYRRPLASNKMPVTAVHVLNNYVLPFLERYNAMIKTILSDNGKEFCGRLDKHPHELFLQLEDIEHRTYQG